MNRAAFILVSPAIEDQDNFKSYLAFVPNKHYIDIVRTDFVQVTKGYFKFYFFMANHLIVISVNTPSV